MFIAALFMVAKTQRGPQCLLIQNWIKKMWCTYTLVYHSARKKDEVEPFVTTWMNLENVMPDEISHAGKAIDPGISLTCGR